MASIARGRLLQAQGLGLARGRRARAGYRVSWVVLALVVGGVLGFSLCYVELVLPPLDDERRPRARRKRPQDDG